MILSLTLLPFFIVGQNCSCISSNTDKKVGTKTFDGLTNTEHSFGFLIRKQVNITDTTIAPKYVIFLHAASSWLFTDSILNTQGTFELQLLDQSTMIIDSVKYSNNPWGLIPSLGFLASLTENQIRMLSQNPIVTLTVKGILKTGFSDRKIRKQQRIFSCLLNSGLR